MRKVIIVGEEPKEEKALKPIEFTRYLDVRCGWIAPSREPKDCDKVVYLGKCSADGDMFVAYRMGEINIYKGHLNDGAY